MKKVSLKVLTLVAVLTTAGLVVVANTGDYEGTLNQIAGYRQWTRVNRKPVQVDASTVAVASPTGFGAGTAV